MVNTEAIIFFYCPHPRIHVAFPAADDALSNDSPPGFRWRVVAVDGGQRSKATLENRRALARTRQRCAALIMMIKVVPGGVEIPSRVASTLCSTRESLPRVAVRFKEEEECVHVLGDKECTETAVCEQGTYYTCDNVVVVSCVKNVCVCEGRRSSDSLDQVLIKIFPSTVVPRCGADYRRGGLSIGPKPLNTWAKVITYEGISGSCRFLLRICIQSGNDVMIL